ncbi:MAG: fibronectin type III domain-containing protein [Candidatus Gracilibacteria bacterium]
MNKKHTKLLATIGISILLTSGAGLIYAQSSDSAQNVAVSADAVEPSDVENLKAQPGDSEVLLTWDKATDNVGVTGYKIYRGTQSVKSADSDYDLPSIPVTGNINSYGVKNLTNGQKYYFTITAKDAAGNESASYATEASATPQSGLTVSQVADDGASPQIKEVKSEDVISVKVIFSEAVKLPMEQPASAFKIEKVLDKSRLAVQKAEVDARDATGKTVILTVEPQK